MPAPSSDIPNRAFFKAADVCEIAQVQAYVLRTWELEFPSLGVARPGGGARIYRRQDVERVLQIKQLVFTEGLTLAGARRRLEGSVPAPADDVSIEALVAPEVREKLTAIKHGLRSILTILSPERAAGEPSFRAVTEASEPEQPGELLPFERSKHDAAVPEPARVGRGSGARPPKRSPRQPKAGG